MSDLQKVKIEDLKVGDIIFYPRYITYVWGVHFKYPKWYKGVVARITPKKTKMVTENGMEFTDKDSLYLPSEECVRQDTIARKYDKLMHDVYTINDKKFDLARMSDEKIEAISDKMNEIMQILEKE